MHPPTPIQAHLGNSPENNCLKPSVLAIDNKTEYVEVDSEPSIIRVLATSRGVVTKVYTLKTLHLKS